MKITREDLTKKPGVAGVAGALAGQGNDFMVRINDTINNFRLLLGEARSSGLPVDRDSSVQGNEATGGMDLRALAELLIKNGYGDTPLGDLAKNVAPFTLNYIRKVLESGNRPAE